jgi:hypothetical protein
MESNQILDSFSQGRQKSQCGNVGVVVMIQNSSGNIGNPVMRGMRHMALKSPSSRKRTLCDKKLLVMGMQVKRERIESNFRRKWRRKIAEDQLILVVGNVICGSWKSETGRKSSEEFTKVCVDSRPVKVLESFG